MSNQPRFSVFYVCLLVTATLLIGGGAAATGPSQADSANLAASVTAEPASLLTSGWVAPLASEPVGMSDLVSQTFEFTGTFPAGWQTYSTISYTVGSEVLGDYEWSTTPYTSAEGVYSAVAMRGGVNGSTLTDTASYAGPVDSWMVFGPVSLASVWEAELDFEYLHLVPITSSNHLTVAISTDYDPVSHIGTFAGKTLSPTTEMSGSLVLSTGWQAGSLDLSSYAGHSVYVAFRYQSPEGGTVADGPFVDDVHLRANYRMMLPLVSKWTLTLSKSASVSVVRPGQSLAYAITVYNSDSQPASGVVLTDMLPVSTTFAGADGAYAYDPSTGVVSWSDLTVPAMGSLVQYLTVTVPSNVPSGASVVNGSYAVSVPPSPLALPGMPITTPVTLDFFDDFSNPASGWPVGNWTGDIVCWPPPGSWRAGYLPNGGGYGVNTACAWNGKLYPAPVRLADPANFTLETDLRSNQADLWYSSYGVFFNGSEDLRQVYVVRLFQGLNPPEWAAYYWPNFMGSSDDQPPPQTLVYATCWSCNGADFARNHILIRRQGAYFEVWMGTPGNLARMATIKDDRLVDNQHLRVGVHHANFEWRGDAGSGFYAYVFDNFHLTPARR